MGDLDIYKSLPISYNKDSNELLINLPKDLKIKFTNSVDIVTEGEFNLLSFGELNLVTIFKNMHFDTLNAQLHLNSRRAKQLFNYDYIPIDIEGGLTIGSLILSRRSALERIESCLHKMSKH